MINKELFQMVSNSPSFFGLELNLLDLYKLIAEFKPKAVVSGQAEFGYPGTLTIFVSLYFYRWLKDFGLQSRLRLPTKRYG